MGTRGATGGEEVRERGGESEGGIHQSLEEEKGMEMSCDRGERYGDVM